MNPHAIAHRLEQYTLKRAGEALLVTARVEGEEDQVIIFRGFSSSLVRSTAFDPDIPVLTEDAEILSVDRLEGPFRPDCPRYIQQSLTLQETEALLSDADV
ncbi:MAG: hypothetical protein WBA57_02995 [Elainellaceae cyanobacterium]